MDQAGIALFDKAKEGWRRNNRGTVILQYYTLSPALMWVDREWSGNEKKEVRHFFYIQKIYRKEYRLYNL